MCRLTKKFRSSCEATNDEDRISNLHESVVCHILSRLPLPDAVRTSVLSKNWECKWTTIYNLDIDDRKALYYKVRLSKCFGNVVDRIFTLLHGLRSFRLYCYDEYESSSMTAWISSALSGNIESLELETYLQKSLLLPQSLVNNSSLRKLKLNSECTFKVPLRNYFPNLTDLHLENVEILNELSSISDQLVFIFPALKTLELIDCKWTNVNLVKICSPSLTTFKCRAPLLAESSGYSITICGPRLEKFIWSGGSAANIVLSESTVRYADFWNSTNDRDPRCDLLVGKLLRQVSSVTYLQLSSYMYEAIAQPRRQLPLPRYDMLQRLIISVTGSAKVLIEFFHLAPFLKFLELYGDAETPAELDCDELESVRYGYGVISHLEEVKFNVMGKRLLFHLAKFLLKNGVKLKKIDVSPSFLRPDVIVERLSKFHRASLDVAVVVNNMNQNLLDYKPKMRKQKRFPF